MQKTSIDYVTHTWDPLAMRCMPVSAGCKNCWHLRMADRLAANPTLGDERRVAYAGGKPVLIEDELRAPYRLKKHAVIGVQFMGDLFHPDVTPEQIWQVIKACYNNPQHTFLILTKRPGRAGDILTRSAWWNNDPPKNIWNGVSVEDGNCLGRINALGEIPAAHRFVSFEPLLSDMPLDVGRFLRKQMIDWAIVGCESGPGRRPMRLEWAIDLVQQCQNAGIQVYVKQVEINGKVSHTPADWPAELQVRELPWEGMDE